MTTKEKLKHGSVKFVDIVNYVNEQYNKTYIYEMYYEMLEDFGKEVSILAFIDIFDKLVERGGFQYYIESNISLESEYNLEVFHKDILMDIIELNIKKDIKDEITELISSIIVEVDYEEKIESKCIFCQGVGEKYEDFDDEYVICEECNGTGIYEEYNDNFLECENVSYLKGLDTKYSKIKKKLFKEIIKNYK